MPKRLVPPLASDVEWWRRKVNHLNDRAFGPAASKWALQVFDALLTQPNGIIRADNLRGLAKELRVPLRYTPRAVATLTRLGIVSARLTSPASVVVRTGLLCRRKNSPQQPRRAISAAQRARLKAQSDHRCACCGRRFRPDDLVTDHIIPLSMLGVDEPANWVVLSTVHNRKRWDRFLPRALKLYRTVRVVRPIGMRFVEGFFWPVINGRVRRTRLGATANTESF